MSRARNLRVVLESKLLVAAIVAHIRAEGGMEGVQDDIATEPRSFDIQGEAEMCRLEDTYLR